MSSYLLEFKIIGGRRRNMTTGSKIHKLLISATGFVFLFSGMALAKAKRIDVIYQARVGKSLTLKPGSYRIDVVNNTKTPAVRFFDSNGKLVGEVPAQVVTKSRKTDETMIDYTKVASTITSSPRSARVGGMKFFASRIPGNLRQLPRDNSTASRGD